MPRAEHTAMFNSVVLPAAINDPSAGVKASGIRHVKFHEGFAFWHGNPGKADTMLTQLTPLIVGVSLHGGTARDPTSIHMTADAQHTVIPCGMPFFGYFG